MKHIFRLRTACSCAGNAQNTALQEASETRELRDALRDAEGTFTIVLLQTYSVIID